jgi:hypothetical protein
VLVTRWCHDTLTYVITQLLGESINGMGPVCPPLSARKLWIGLLVCSVWCFIGTFFRLQKEKGKCNKT